MTVGNKCSLNWLPEVTRHEDEIQLKPKVLVKFKHILIHCSSLITLLKIMYQWFYPDYGSLNIT